MGTEVIGPYSSCPSCGRARSICRCTWWQIITAERRRRDAAAEREGGDIAKRLKKWFHKPTHPERPEHGR